MTILYTAHVTTVAGRAGHSKSDDGVLDLKLGKPGAKDGSTNPEQLFAAGYSACFGSALLAVAKKENAPVSSVEVTADVSLNEENGAYGLSVVLHSTLGGVDDATAKALTEKAHTLCPYSKATQGNIDVKLEAKGTGTQQAA